MKISAYKIRKVACTTTTNILTAMLCESYQKGFQFRFYAWWWSSHDESITFPNI